ncbi:MAG: Maf family protein [Candidatus Rokuibacteriota bacterium]
MRLILASSSPRRRALLAALGLAFEIVPSRIDESRPSGVPVPALAEHLALRKARDVAGRCGSALVLGADTLVAVEGRALGKPASSDEARGMLAALSGRTHEVVTAVALVEAPAGREVAEAVLSRVVMRPYSAAEIDAYLLTGESFDKAGAYAVQGAGGHLVARVEGCYTNVVGLPVKTTARLLRAFGVPVADPPPKAGPGWVRGAPGPR